ncbi:DUF4262 domain-containing protein [Bacillus mexicanus]|uniref:DUF4262 domain-containing protein n=1 Tax=Bacillus mexicanus TaxID=2834415 RepID=UPI003D1BB5F7
MDNKRFQLLEAQRQEMMDNYGWVTDYVFPTEEGELANIHTHGVKENFNHMDFQIVLTLPPEMIQILLANLVERVKNGEQIVTEKRYDDIIENFDVYFVKQKEGNRSVLRMILPDDQGKFPDEKNCKPYYDKQLIWDTIY